MVNVNRRSIICLFIIIDHNRRQYEMARDLGPERMVGRMIQATYGLMCRRGGGGLYNDFVDAHPGIDQHISGDTQIKRLIDTLRAAGLMEQSRRVGRKIIEVRGLEPSEAGVTFINQLIKRYGTDPHNWPLNVPVNDGRAKWDSAVTNAPMSAGIPIPR